MFKTLDEKITTEASSHIMDVKVTLYHQNYYPLYIRETFKKL